MLTSPADTLVCDTVQIAKWQSESAYDYNRELITPEINIFEWFRRQFGELLRKIFGSRFAEEYSELILICLAIIILLLIIWFVYKKRPELFMRSSRINCLMKWRKIRFTVWIFGRDCRCAFPFRLSGGGAPALFADIETA